MTVMKFIEKTLQMQSVVGASQVCTPKQTKHAVAYDDIFSPEKKQKTLAQRKVSDIQNALNADDKVDEKKALTPIKLNQDAPNVYEKGVPT